MKRFWLPALLLGAVVMTAWVILRPYFVEQEPPPQPLAVSSGDQEIVWLMPATSGPNWERFVTAVGRAAVRLKPTWPDALVDTDRAYPPSSTDVPEVSLSWGKSGQRLCFRWYKLTSRWKTDPWVAALLRERQPPLAFIGGSSSEAATSLAQALEKQTRALPELLRPLLLLTSATADRVSLQESFGMPQPPEEQIDLMGIYPGRTFRFCFTNNQMADAISRFVCSHPDLRPQTVASAQDGEPVYLVRWNDDSYSYDLSNSFLRALSALAVEGSLADWAWVTGCIGQGGLPGLHGGVLPWERYPRSFFPRQWEVLTSVGSFYTANRDETAVAGQVSRALTRGGISGGEPTQTHPGEPGRSLLLVTGQVQPMRRFLRALERLDPDRARRLVVATGDAISFNTVYRDRRSCWSIQDLPMTLVFFCHYNPVERRAGFRPTPEGGVPLFGPGEEPAEPVSGTPGEEPSSSTGTEDVLLNADIVRSLARAYWHDDEPSRNAAELADRLRQVKLDPQGQSLFASNGNRRSGTGEHIVYLRPMIQNGRVLPRAKLEVWSWRPSRSAANPGPTWELRDAPLLLNYDPPTVEGGVHQ